MSLSTNRQRSRFPLHQPDAFDFETGGKAESIGSTPTMQGESRDCVISFPRKPYDQVEQTKFNSWNGDWHWHIRTDTTVWSEQLYRLIGRETATIPPFKEHFRFYTSESWIRLVDATLLLLQTGTPYELTLQMLHNDGGQRWVIRSGEAVSDEHGDIFELRGTVQDVSELMAQQGNTERDWWTGANAEDTTGHLIQAQEEKNAKLAIELRDSICQRVSLLAVEIQSSNSTCSDLSPRARAQLESFWEKTTGILAELNRVSDLLYPVVLDLLRTPSAMRCLCQKFTREHGIPVEYNCSDVPANHLDKQCGLVLYRVLQEILTNVVRHSRAKNVTVSLEHDAAELRLRVSDNGVGFDRAKAKTAVGLGFARMKAQIGHIGGSLAVWSQHGGGTSIEARIPSRQCSHDSQAPSRFQRETSAGDSS
jgi:signal transduction histidine kinase